MHQLIIREDIVILFIFLVIGVRKIKTEQQASYLVENNLLDCVAVGRAMIFQPHWMEKARDSYLKRAGKNNESK